MALAKLTVDLVLGLAAFEQDAGKAAAVSEAMLQRIGKGAAVAAGAIAGYSTVAATAAVGALVWVDRIAKQTAELHGLAEATGTTASAIASFRTASDTSGVGLEKVSAILQRLNTTMSREIPSKGVAAALKAIGINAEELRALKPDEQLELIAKKLWGFAEGAGRGAAATVLLGKSGAAALPFLNDLAEAGRSQIKLTDEQIDLTDRYSKAQERSRSELSQLAQVAALQALPALNAFVESLRDTAQAVVGVDASTKVLGKSTAIADFSESAVKSLGFVIDAGDGVARTFQLVGTYLGGSAAAAAAVLSGRFSEARTISAEFKRDAEALLQSPLFSDRLAARLAAAKKAPTAEPAKPELDFRIPAAATKSVTASTSAYDGLLRSIVAKNTAAEAELAGTERLTEAQKFAVDVVSKLAATEGKFTTTQKQAATGALEAYLINAQALELRQRQAVASEDLRRSTEASAVAFDREADARLTGNQALRDALVEYGRTGAEIERLRITRLEDALATEEQALAVGRTRDLSDAEAAGMERNIVLLRQQIELRRQGAAVADRDRTSGLAGATSALNEYAEAARETGIATRQATGSALQTLESDLTASFVTGKTNLKSFTDFVISEVVRLAVVRPLLASLAKQLEDLSKQSTDSGSGFMAILRLFAGGASSGGGFGTGSNFGNQDYGAYLATGTNRIPYDGFKAVLHKDEAVVPAAFNPYAPSAIAAAQQARPTKAGPSDQGGRGTWGLNQSINVRNEAGDVVQASASKSNSGDIEVLVRKIVRDENGRDLSSGGGAISAGLKARGVNLSGALPRRA
jgi:lambda family phage tail tape measure protein